jgi:hypothetical protein
MDRTTRLIRWQRITIAVLFLAFLSTAFAAAYETRRSEARLKDVRRLRQQVSEYEAEMRKHRLMPEDIEYLRWFNRFDQACLKMSNQQARALDLAEHSMEENSLEPAIAAAETQWLESQSRFRQTSPPPACEAVADAYAERLGLISGQVRRRVHGWMMISSRGYDMNTPQSRKQVRAWTEYRARERDIESGRKQLEATTHQLNAALEQISHTPGTPLPQDLARLRVRWMAFLHYEK